MQEIFSRGNPHLDERGSRSHGPFMIFWTLARKLQIQKITIIEVTAGYAAPVVVE